MPSAPPTCAPGHCQVPGCKADLLSLRQYYQRYHICEQHSRASEVLLGNELCRFCQLCGRFHAITAFSDSRRSCKARLAKHNARRKLMLERKAAEGSYRPRNKAKGKPHKAAPCMQRTDDDAGAVAAANPAMLLGAHSFNSDSGAAASDALASYRDEEALMPELNLRCFQPPATDLSTWPHDVDAGLLPTRISYVPPAVPADAPLTAAGEMLGVSPLCLPSTVSPAVSAGARLTAVGEMLGVSPLCLPSTVRAPDLASVQLAPTAGIAPASLCLRPRPQRSNSTLSQQSTSSPGHRALPLAALAASGGVPSSSGAEGSDVAASTELAGFASVWREWGGESGSPIEPHMCNLKLNLLAPSRQDQAHVKGLGSDQSLDALWQSIQMPPCPAPLAEQASKFCWLL